jgi:hypothetical protein
MTQTSKLTNTGEIMGTPAYMAPEQARGQGGLVGEATDVHALGAILYEMLTGRAPYGHDAPVDVLVRVLMEEPMAPRRIDRRIPRDLETVCLKALAKDPQRRYATVNAMREDVRRFEAGLPVLARRPGLVSRGLRLLRRRWKTAATIALTVALTAAVVVALTTLALGPRADQLPAPDQLLAAGDERHTGGNHGAAAEFYRRALRSADPSIRVTLLERLVRCCREDGNKQGAVVAALQMLDYDPDACFGEFDYPVAQAVLAQKLGVKANPSVGITRDISPEELAAKRLQIFLNEPYGSEKDRARAEQTLAELRVSFGKVPAGFTGIPDRDLSWPEGDPAELLRRAANEKAHPMERAPAAFAAAVALEKADETPAALAAYRQAYELWRRYCPASAGVVSGFDVRRSRSYRLECQECIMLRHLAHAVRCLDPESKDPLRGGLRFRITGLDLTPEMVKQLSLSLWDSTGPDPERAKQLVGGRWVPALLGSVTVRIDQTAWVGVADGRYRLAVQAGSKGSWRTENFGARANLLLNRMELDFSGLPEEVEVRGNIVELPAIRAWLRE